MAAAVLHVYSLRPLTGDLTAPDTWAPPYDVESRNLILDRSSSRKEQEITLWPQKSAGSPICPVQYPSTGSLVAGPRERGHHRTRPGEIDPPEPGDRLADRCGARLVIGGRMAPLHLGRQT